MTTTSTPDRPAAYLTSILSKPSGVRISKSDGFVAEQVFLSLEPPSELSAPQQQAVRQAVASAYVSGFRVVMAVSAGLAVLGALTAWRMVEGKEAKREG